MFGPPQPMLIIANPIAGRRRPHLLWRVVDVLVQNGVRVEVAQTKRAGDATAWARAAALAGTRVIVAAGGDGTIAEVANGITGTESKLGIIPQGTANVFAHEVGLPASAHELAAALAFGRGRHVWPGHFVNGVRSGLFMQMLGVGFDAHVVHRLSPRLKRFTGRWAYVGQTMRELSRYRYHPIRLSLDGQPTEAASVVIAKGRFYGGPFLLAPAADPGKPGFSVILFEHSGPAAALAYGAALPLNRLSRSRGIRVAHAERIEFPDGARIPAQADGDAAGWAPSLVTDSPNQIELVLPQR